jgi:hypothetical protein
LKLGGKINHDELFFKDDGSPIRNLQYPWIRWRRALTVTVKGRYRDPYNARHSSVSWNLMIGKNPLWVAKQHGHSVQTMLETYAAWLEGTSESDLAAIRRAMDAPAAPSIRVIQGGRSSRDSGHLSPSLPLESPRAVTTLPLEREPELQLPDNWQQILAEREGFEPNTLSY